MYCSPIHQETVLLKFVMLAVCCHIMPCYAGCHIMPACLPTVQQDGVGDCVDMYSADLYCSSAFDAKFVMKTIKCCFIEEFA
jgi:hypothetical protein